MQHLIPTRFTQKVIRQFTRWTTPTDKTPEEGLIFWQDRVVSSILLTATCLGIFAYIPSVLLCIKEELWSIAIFDTAIYALVVGLTLFRRIPFHIRAYAIIFSSYFLGLVLVWIVGPGAAGPVWMFMFPVLAGVLLGFRASMTALLINIVTLIGIGLLIHMDFPRWMTPQPHTIERWIVISFNFILLNALAALALSIVLSGLQESLNHEKTMRKSLEQHIADKKKEEMEKQRLRENLLQAQKMESIGTLAGGIAHDFNNILSSILGYTELALDDVQKKSLMEENLKEVYTAGLRAKDLVKQILAIARKTDENLKPIRIRSIAEETAKLLRATVPATIEMRLDLDTDALILGSPSQVHQIFMNLCTNAVHAMEETGGQLGIRVTDTVFSETVADSHIQVKPGEYILITISDTGAGIPPELIDTIFEPYVTTKAPGEGTGLGLAVVHGIVKTYGGEISIESTVGSGTVFSIYLPAIKGSESELPEPPEAPASGTEHILLVDDEPSVVQYVAQSLERLGYTVSVKTTAKAALSLFESGPRDFDLIVTDMTMPQMTGEQLADAVKKIRPDMPVVLCTGYSKRISRLGEMPGSVDAILAKPVSRSDLAKTVRNMLDEKKGKE